MDPKFNLGLAAATAALEASRELGLDSSIVVVDASGRDMIVLRQDLASWASLPAARKKAATAAAMNMPTHLIAELVAQDPISERALHANPDLLAVPGGFPLMLDGICIGGLGVAGGAWPDDQIVAERAMTAIGSGEAK
jgi:uncharacterized protein GlcG (DUF336 family)